MVRGNNLMLLDTCALLWLSQGGGQLSAATCKQIYDVSVEFRGQYMDLKGKKYIYRLNAWLEDLAALYRFCIDQNIICCRETEIAPRKMPYPNSHGFLPGFCGFLSGVY